jgi:hypothetical protein
VRTPAWKITIALLCATATMAAAAACSSKNHATGAGEPTPTWIDASAQPGASASASGGPSPSAKPSPSLKPAAKLKAGNPNGHATVPAAAKAVDTSHPTRVIGKGTPASCTSEAVVSAVGKGGIVTFNCGTQPVTITMKATAKVRNTNAKLVLDAGGLVTLSGGGMRRILYQNTCDKAQVWTTSHCDDQATPELVVQNITFTEGNSTGDKTEGGGGGAIFIRGGRLKVVNAKFTRNKCDSTGPDLGGAAIRALSQYHNQPIYIVNSTFDHGVCSNGSGFSSIQVSWVVLNSLFTNNSAIGRGANPQRSGTPGGGSGGAIYLDGDNFTLTLGGTVIQNNHANEGGGAVFFVSNDRTGTMTIDHSTLSHNKSDGFETDGLPGIFFLGARRPTIISSKLTR